MKKYSQSDEICTPSKTVMGIANTNRQANLTTQIMKIPQVVPTPSTTNQTTSVCKTLLYNYDLFI